MVGFGANRRGGRLPSFILIALMVIIAILSFNYWTVSNKQGRLLDELAEVQTQVKRTDAARSRLEKRNSELMVQVDTHRKHIDQKDGDNSMLEVKLQAREALIKKCTDEKMKVQGDVTAQMSEIVRLKEQLKELKQEFMRQEIQLREVKKNSTNLERKLEYESLQCGRQITQLMDEHEKAKKTLEEEAVKLRKSVLDIRKVGAAEGGTEVETAGEHPTVATRRDTDLKGLGKPGSDAGMPGIEDSEVGKIDDVQFALKKPAITQNHIEIPDTGLREVGAGEGAGRDPSLDRPVLQIQDRVLGLGMEGLAGALQQQPPQAVADRPILFDEDNKAAIQADEFGEQHRQLRAPANVMKADGVQRKGAGLPLPPNPAQVPNPIEPRHARDPKPAEPLRHRQSRFFDENESPVDPQHGSKLADYNGDDGNVGEYEADKQAELAYNEEEDGDGGEEDVQDDEDRDMQGDRAVDYGKRRQAIDIL
ncbi:protein GOLM2 isoform X2 [Salmo salar]|uniref:Protein GOLM2 n=1 Tax=Salmo salar TaxID=8030 RepID=A0A1S3KUJ2_SALSA|nr:protein GOLM2 isoform X2 [Salmo salar]|eukprot:XP_013982280.1 PREDICTED: protein CASC4-like isoform X2 [Salmo salar]